ncbi:MAG: response regulator, partial [Clostridiales bacterium]
MRKNILVVDDDKDIRELITVYMQTENFNVDKASNGEEALNLIEEKNYDLVLLDIMMPKVDGLQTLIEIRKNHTMPVIFLTAKNDEIDMIKGLALGADDYIPKPFSSMELIARVKSHL